MAVRSAGVKLKVTDRELTTDLLGEVKARTGVDVQKCYQCGKCTAGCPMAFQMDFAPSQVMRLVQLGARDAALESDTIWVCASCETCTTRCPQEVEIARVMDGLRELAMKAGKATRRKSDILNFHKAFLNSVRKYGRAFEVGMIQQYKMKRALKALLDPFGELADVEDGIKMFARGKIALLPHKVKNREAVQRIFEKCEGRQSRPEKKEME
ncbi:MAG: 4Fe-4S dicluster domain-containing protein [Planctomycetes bacterium]|nr:4Fe-4S dicluster domain-containing protein [Planctomycetota bacterium]MBM4079376.1 4Fe-4S dicluster domain-containing protein [Planctomycetota bacterium]MBM4085696.1 4Fe-4S dicluster domain-containing protein [Planctomycetota bacterium]